ncbi:MAG: ABC transporter substrate-binding protein [Flavobacteriales bacterium]|nr:ABC transporter substrate-binding protein [Flavobacteriales bacterium]
MLAVLMAGCGPSKGRVHGLGSVYGGVFNFNQTQLVRNLFPLSITLVSEQHIAMQVYEGLVRFNSKNLQVEPALAESWEVDPTHTIYTFHLREGVRFHDDPAFPDGIGRELTAGDVVHCFTALCEQGVGDAMFWILQEKVAGADAYHNAGKKGGPVSGIQALDERTVQITLVRPFPNFLQSLAVAGCTIWPRELPGTYGTDLIQHAIGTGPFRLAAARPGEAIVLERNPNYWGRDAQGRQLPYLDAVRITLDPDKEKEVAAFLAGRLSMVNELSPESVEVLADSLDPVTGRRRFNLLATPALAVQYYCFNLSKPPFSDARVRRAFAMALDRRALVDSIMQGLATPAEHGLVAPGLDGYPYHLVAGIPYDPEGARRLLAEAGYPGGKGFPRVQLQVDNNGFGYRSMATMAQDMLVKELRVAVTVSTVPTNVYYERIEHGEALFWREGWVADLPDAENILALLYGKNAVADTSMTSVFNTTRYASPRYDEQFSKARAVDDSAKRMHHLAQADHFAMQDVPVVPLYHERYTMLVAPKVVGLHINAMELLDLREVRLRPEAAHTSAADTTS